MFHRISESVALGMHPAIPYPRRDRFAPTMAVRTDVAHADGARPRDHLSVESPFTAVKLQHARGLAALPRALTCAITARIIGKASDAGRAAGRGHP